MHQHHHKSTDHLFNSQKLIAALDLFLLQVVEKEKKNNETKVSVSMKLQLCR